MLHLIEANLSKYGIYFRKIQSLPYLSPLLLFVFYKQKGWCPMALRSEYTDREIKGWILPVSFIVFAFIMLVLKEVQ
jgi:hypothetical protein